MGSEESNTLCFCTPLHQNTLVRFEHSISGSSALLFCCEAFAGRSSSVSSDTQGTRRDESMHALLVLWHTYMYSERKRESEQRADRESVSQHCLMFICIYNVVC